MSTGRISNESDPYKRWLQTRCYDLWCKGRTFAELGKEFKLHPATVSHYVNLEGERRQQEFMNERAALIGKQRRGYENVIARYQGRMAQPGFTPQDGAVLLKAMEGLNKLLGLEVPSGVAAIPPNGPTTLVAVITSLPPEQQAAVLRRFSERKAGGA